jgi:hypothetical protein
MRLRPAKKLTETMKR